MHFNPFPNSAHTHTIVSSYVDTALFSFHSQFVVDVRDSSKIKQNCNHIDTLELFITDYQTLVTFYCICIADVRDDIYVR